MTRYRIVKSRTEDRYTSSFWEMLHALDKGWPVYEGERRLSHIKAMINKYS